LRDLEYTLHKKINEYKKKMITLKLDLLFGYQTEENTIELFKENNKLLTENEKLLYECHNFLLDLSADKEEKEKEYNETIKNELEDIKRLTEQFKKSKEPTLIEEIIKKYIDVVYPVLTNLRKTKYHNNDVECEQITKNEDVSECKLIQDEFKIEETELYFGDETKVISYSV
jgi:hypothetical protein